MKNNSASERYKRQISIKEFGEASQQKLSAAKLLMVGAGGLGCPILQYLCAAGIGTIGIIDDDVVMLNNLHRQILYSVNDIGKSKAEQASKHLQRLNPDIKIISYNLRLSTDNAIDLINQFDYVVDGTDNFATRYMINDACVLMNKPLIYGAISQFEGQVSIFNSRSKKSEQPVNYRDIFPEPPKTGEVLNCEEAGVLGIMPGIIGLMMANETIKLITGIGEPLINKLLTFNALTNQQYELQLNPTEISSSLIPKDINAFKQTNYEWLCSPGIKESEIDMDAFLPLINNKDVDIIDVREPGEWPDANDFIHIKIPLKELEENTASIKNKTVVCFCKSGTRSYEAAKKLSSIFKNEKTVYSLKGGILLWNKYHANQKHE
ncbi:MAG TPA: HesA/MoeB/ThiF family protein [Puia sp.]|nr:HesA/MoeB/ThiF family protein [Puia sp.]